MTYVAQRLAQLGVQRRPRQRHNRPPGRTRSKLGPRQVAQLWQMMADRRGKTYDPPLCQLAWEWGVHETTLYTRVYSMRDRPMSRAIFHRLLSTAIDEART